MSDTAQTPRDSMYCHSCHNQWQRQGEDIECPACRSSSTEIVTSDDDPRHFHGRQPQGQTESQSAPTNPEPAPVYGPERPPSTTTPPQSHARPASPQGNTSTQRPAVAATHQFIFAPMTFHFTIITDQGPPPQSQAQQQQRQASATTEQQQPSSDPQSMNWFGMPMPFFIPPFLAPQPRSPPSSTTTSPPVGPTEGGSSSPSSNQPQAQTQTQSENGQQQQTEAQRPAGPRTSGASGLPGGFMALFLASLFDQGAAGVFGNPDAVYSQEAFDRIITELREANANGGGGAPPASQSALDKLQTKEVDDAMLASAEDKPKCVICVDEMVKGDKATILPCNHLFHGDCVTLWLKQHNTCPVCRRSIEEEVHEKPAKTAVHEFQAAHQSEHHEHAHNSTTGCM